jgi:hypothetical protein
MKAPGAPTGAVTQEGAGLKPPVKTPPPIDKELKSLVIEPEDASRDTKLILSPKGFYLDDAEMVVWLLNKTPASTPAPYEFESGIAHKGDTVQAKAMFQGEEILSNIITIENAPPEIARIKIMPEVFKPGDTLYVDVEGTDADGDEVTILYDWTLNNESVSAGRKLETSLKRGDVFSVSVTPFDGESYGSPVILTREIQNLPPVITGDEKGEFDQEVLTVKIKASDPDEDKLAYSLENAPEGMIIDGTTGVITWKVPAGYTGKSTVTVTVADGNGGKATKDYSFRVAEEKEPVPAKPASE